MKARERKPIPLDERKCGSLDEACQRYALGRNLMREVVKDAGAEIHIRGRLLVNFTKLDQYMDSLSE